VRVKDILLEKEILLERVSDVVFYGRGLKSAIEILLKNRFELSPAPGHPSEEKVVSKKRKLYFMSTGRIPTNMWRDKGMAGKAATFVLDGYKLSQNYHGKAIKFFDTPETETEDRIYSEKPFIPNAVKYIKELHIFDNKVVNDIEKYRDCLGRIDNHP